MSTWTKASSKSARATPRCAALAGKRTPRPTRCGASLSTPRPPSYSASTRSAAKPCSRNSTWDEESYVFTGSGRNVLKPYPPDAVSSRYKKMATRLGINTHIHALRHFSATELLTAGVDLRTVAGRLGHGGGGATTLRVYAAWGAAADQKAAEILGSRMPKRQAHG
ncbi:tyrosine-type recombinase/integrase [Amycolatopsis cynarae]|uniref:Tyrosine-type recombinase/integrase n=1 Tax=Amycolatopsis cynarae TaxID=2995223 RepID=A0ABY7AUX6_9PSEU|nr:tyrosine-type recombinase/integrase [Amycolatopsis sp. HUAS 11-8]WAL63776.1 tyrosine-type recombinase/integrase [Amycolatopsis sp. HUAS 11-8]